MGLKSHPTKKKRVRFPADAKDFSLLHSIQTGSEAHPAPSPMETGD
jgi:hypothetical protein